MSGRLPALVLTLFAALPVAPAAAIELGVQDDPLVVRLPSAFGGFGADRLLAPDRVDALLDDLAVDTVRINLPWAQVAGTHPGGPLQLGLYEVAGRLRGRIARYSIWNEPNWWNLLRPRKRAARIYRRLFLQGSAAVRAADPAAKVLIGELAPLAQPAAATAPLTFLRRLTCADARWGARPGSRCSRLVADGFAHHPYTLLWSPEYPGRGP